MKEKREGESWKYCRIKNKNLKRAFLDHWQVNPYEVENVADTLNKALEMPLDERQLRMFQLKKREKRMDVDHWVQSFLTAMGAVYDGIVRRQNIFQVGLSCFDNKLYIA